MPTQSLTAAEYHAKYHGKIFKQSESALQQNCVRWFDYQYPELRLNLFSIPNEGARSKANGARMKAQGRRKGAPDMFFAKPKPESVPFGDYDSHGTFIEFKTATGKQSPEQREFEIAVTKQGYDYKIIRSIEEFILLIEKFNIKFDTHENNQ